MSFQQLQQICNDEMQVEMRDGTVEQFPGAFLRRYDPVIFFHSGQCARAGSKSDGVAIGFKER